jgi:hypothetical protein
MDLMGGGDFVQRILSTRRKNNKKIISPPGTAANVRDGPDCWLYPWHTMAMAARELGVSTSAIKQNYQEGKGIVDESTASRSPGVRIALNIFHHRLWGWRAMESSVINCLLI